MLGLPDKYLKTFIVKMIQEVTHLKQGKSVRSHQNNRRDITKVKQREILKPN